MNLEQLTTLFAYNDWANDLVLTSAKALDQETYAQKHDMGNGWEYSIGSMLSHLRIAEFIWLRRWQGQSPTSLPNEEDTPTLSVLLAAWEPLREERRAYIAALTPEKIAADLTYTTTTGVAYRQKLWQLLMHLINHGTEHRSHLSPQLSRLGQPTPDLGFMNFLRQRE